jgi:MFS family permease
MPRVPKRSPHRLAAPSDAVRDAAVERLGAAPLPDGTLKVTSEPGRQPAVDLTFTLMDEADGTHLFFTPPAGGIDIPYFAWFFRPMVRVAHRRQAAHAVASIQAELGQGPEPAPPKPVLGLPTVGFDHTQSTLLATAAAAIAVVSFASALFGQLNGPISDAYHASDQRITTLLAITRLGALPALFITSLADRRGRRRSILIGVVGSAFACAASALSPTLGALALAQVVQRALLITTATVAGIAVIEEAPEQARAYSASMLALAGGLGFSIAVVVLPFADIGTNGWRIPFGVGALTIFLAPQIARRLRETTRYTDLAARADIARGRFRDVWRHHRRRFVLLGAAAFLTNVFSAPSSQLMNKYLLDDRGFSNSGIAVFRTVTTAVPGLLGLLLGGRLAEARGRRPVAAISLAVATATQMVFFLAGGLTIWVMSAVSILAASSAGIALGTLDAELFPTEVRSTSNAWLSVVAVSGSAAGFAIAGALSGPFDGLGRAIAVTGVFALLAAVLVVPRLPESGTYTLEEISPTHGAGPGEYGADP